MTEAALAEHLDVNGIDLGCSQVLADPDADPPGAFALIARLAARPGSAEWAPHPLTAAGVSTNGSCEPAPRPPASTAAAATPRAVAALRRRAGSAGRARRWLRAWVIGRGNDVVAAVTGHE